MGGCVATLLERRNARTVIPHYEISKFRAYGQQIATVPNSKMLNRTSIFHIANIKYEEHKRIMKSFYTEPNWVHMVKERTAELKDRNVISYRVLDHMDTKVVKDTAGREKTLSCFHMKPERNFVTYAELWQTIESLARGFHEIGLSAGQRVVIYEESRWEWVVGMYGIWLNNMVAATVYANLGPDALRFTLKETECSGIVCNGSVVPTLVKHLESANLKPKIIYLDDLPKGYTPEGFECYSWNEVVEKGSASSAPVTIPTNNDDLALIMYTSGTTGNPKGVMHTHGSIAAGIRALNHRLLDLYKPNEDETEVYCSYLPLAHILEFAIVNIILNRGAHIGFGNPRTLTDEFCKPCGDLQEYKPLALLGVPRVFDTVKKTVEVKVPPPGSFKRKIFDYAMVSRLAWLQKGMETPVWNRKAFVIPKKFLGGNVYGMLSGGGPLSPTTQNFVNVCLGGPLIVQGWGLTETVSVGATQRLGDLETESVGQILISAEMCLQDTEEFKHTDKPEPRGEILIRGPFLFKGYYKQPELTKEVIDEDGWFHTGDVGALTPNGSLRIVGRVKGLAKNVLGEYIAMETLEAIYTENSLCIVNGVCVLVHPEKSYVSALVLTDEQKAMRFAKANNLAGDYAELLKNPEFHKKAAESLRETGVANNRLPFELVKNVHVLNEEWTPENGFLTPTLKVRRPVVEKHYKEIISQLFKDE